MTRPCVPKPNETLDHVAEFLARGGKIDYRKPGESALDPVFHPVQLTVRQRKQLDAILKAN